MKRLAVAGRLALAAAAYLTGATATGDRQPGLKPAEAQALLERYEERSTSGDVRGAMASLRLLLRSYPDNPDYLSREADLLDRLRDYRREAAAWELFMQVAPFPADACLRLTRAYGKLGLDEKAFQTHQRCLSIDPSQLDLKFFMAHALEMRGSLDEAEKLYGGILADAPTYSDAGLGLARIRTRQGRYAEAEKLINGVLKRSKTNSDALLAWAIVADDTGRREQAKEKLLEAIAASPAYADLYRVLGRWYDRDGDRQEALRIYASLQRLEPEDSAVRKKLAELRGDAP